MISEQRFEEIDQLMRRFGPANCWTGTSGELARAVFDLKNHIEKIQPKQETQLYRSAAIFDVDGKLIGGWQLIGNVGFIQAAKERAVRFCTSRGSTGKWIAKVRCDSGDIPDATFEVEVTLEAKVLNPRQGAE